MNTNFGDNRIEIMTFYEILKIFEESIFTHIGLTYSIYSILSTLTFFFSGQNRNWIKSNFNK